MAFVEPITIKEAIDNIYKRNYLLPAIQREFVWDTYQIERLFDSIMRDYPISSFLFWEVDATNIKQYGFYEFIREYHERDNKHNEEARLAGDTGIMAILDGQQRLTALYIGLKGTYAYRLPRKRWQNDNAFPKRKLCLNLLAPSKDADFVYDFRFLTDKESSHQDDNQYWFIVGNILELDKPVEINKYLISNGLSRLEEQKAEFANEALYKLWEAIHKTKTINFFLEKDESLQKVLNIFIRVNSGGTQLSYSDLLLSIATAQWKNKNAREEITSFVDDINKIGYGFNFNKDFVLKSCLVLSDFKDIAFKVENFNQHNMLTIEKNWESISESIKTAALLCASFGYHRDTLTSNNALIPIAYYLQKINCPENFVESQNFKAKRDLIFKWLVAVLLKRIFSGQPDNVLRPIRDIISNGNDEFPYESITGKLKGTTKAINFNDDEIENLLLYQYGQAYAFSSLALLYPTLDFRNKFHQDHIFPQKMFTQKRLEKAGIPADDIEFYLENFNCLANLQLLDGVQNQEKSSTPFDEWITNKYPRDIDRKAYMERHFIPDIDLSLQNFRNFIEERKKKLKIEFERLLKA